MHSRFRIFIEEIYARKISVANGSLIVSLDRSVLTHRVARLAPKHFDQILHGVDIVLGR